MTNTSRPRASVIRLALALTSPVAFVGLLRHRRQNFWGLEDGCVTTSDSIDVVVNHRRVILRKVRLIRWSTGLLVFGIW